MGRIEDTFARAKPAGGAAKKLLVAYVCIGDPSVDESIAIARACVEAGADILELGTPFSDPTADGPAIARASERAIANGGGFLASIRAARALREASVTREVPLVLFGYYNPIFVRGDARAIDEAADAGIDALLVVDLPLDEGVELRARARARGVAIVPLVAPTTSDARIELLRATSGSDRDNRATRGFVYYVSVTGVTGAAAAPLEDASRAASRVRERTGLPTVIGFGIDSGEKARVAAAGADGVVVGTAIVLAVENGATPAARDHSVRALVASLRAALDAS